jgi:hypothetical protein
MRLAVVSARSRTGSIPDRCLIIGDSSVASGMPVSDATVGRQRAGWRIADGCRRRCWLARSPLRRSGRLARTLCVGICLARVGPPAADPPDGVIGLAPGAEADFVRGLVVPKQRLVNEGGDAGAGIAWIRRGQPRLSSGG